MILTRAHRDSILSRLAGEGFDTETLLLSGLLTCVAAEDLLSEFMVYGIPQRRLFHATVGRLIARSRSATGDARLGRERLFGEMVSLLWNFDLGATVSLEERCGTR